MAHRLALTVARIPDPDGTGDNRHRQRPYSCSLPPVSNFAKPLAALWAAGPPPGGDAAIPRGCWLSFLGDVRSNPGGVVVIICHKMVVSPRATAGKAALPGFLPPKVDVLPDEYDGRTVYRLRAEPVAGATVAHTVKLTGLGQNVCQL
jgi:hypothetical protein